jgi:hypothetical protein
MCVCQGGHKSDICAGVFVEGMRTSERCVVQYMCCDKRYEAGYIQEFGVARMHISRAYIVHELVLWAY